jgi:hypothetical protein
VRIQSHKQSVVLWVLLIGGTLAWLCWAMSWYAFAGSIEATLHNANERFITIAAFGIGPIALALLAYSLARQRISLVGLGLAVFGVALTIGAVITAD